MRSSSHLMSTDCTAGGAQGLNPCLVHECVCGNCETKQLFA